MAMKKAAPKKGDEPVRMGRAKAQTTKGFVNDPYNWTNPSWAKGFPVEKSVNKISKQLNKDVKKLVAEGKQKYGTKFVVSITGDATAELTAGATKKGIKAQSARTTKQSNRITSLPKKKK
jgi:hypothetical protein